MAELQALVIKDDAGNITRIVRTYETSRRADEDRDLIEGELATGLRAEIIPIDHIEN